MKRSTRSYILSLILFIISMPILFMWKKYSSFGIVVLAFSLGFLYRAFKYHKEEKFMEDED